MQNMGTKLLTRQADIYTRNVSTLVASQEHKTACKVGCQDYFKKFNLMPYFLDTPNATFQNFSYVMVLTTATGSVIEQSIS